MPSAASGAATAATSRDASLRDVPSRPEARTQRASVASTAAGFAPPPEAPPLPANRADYVARNSARCAGGDRRACAAVTCEQSGRLDSAACQAAVGYRRGAGWDVRPRSDLFEPGRTHDEFVLTCRDSGRRATLVRDRTSEAYAWPGRNAPAVTAAALPAAAAEFCVAR